MELIVWMSLAPTVSGAFYDHRLIYLPTSTFSEHLAWLEWLETGRYRSRAVSLSKAAADHRHRRCRKRTKKFIKYLQQVWLLFLNRFATVCFPDSNQNVWPSLIEFVYYFESLAKWSRCPLDIHEMFYGYLLDEVCYLEQSARDEQFHKPKKHTSV